MEQGNIQPNFQPNVIQKSSKAPAIISALCVVLALAGIGFGVYGMFFKNPEKPADDESSSVQENVPSVGAITTLLSERYKLFDAKGVTGSAGTVLADFVYGDNAEGLSETAKLFLVIKQEYPYSDCGNYEECSCSKKISYEELNGKYHEYFGDSVDLEKGVTHTHKHIWIGVDNVKYIDTENSFEVKYPSCLGGLDPTNWYYTNIIDVKRTSEGIAATAIVVNVNAEDVKLFSVDPYDPFNDPIIDMSSLAVKSALYNFNFIEENNIYKLVSITKQ